MNLFKANEHTEDHHIRKSNDDNCLFELEDENYIYVGDKVFSFQTNDKIFNYSSKLSFNDINFSFAYGEENKYFMLYQKLFTIQEHESSTEKDEYQYLFKKDDELKGDEKNGFVEYADDFINCKMILNKIELLEKI